MEGSANLKNHGKGYFRGIPVQVFKNLYGIVFIVLRLLLGKVEAESIFQFGSHHGCTLARWQASCS
jgi:hypothetical protein